MQGVEYFRDGDQLLAILVRASASSSDKYNFLTDSSAPFQLGMNFYKAGDKIPGHFHLTREISLNQIQEVIVIGHGKTKITIYGQARQKLAEATLAAGDIILLASGGHGFEILEDTKIVEVKQGPYDGKVKDKIAL
ncbi:MAG TPA: hypothetical protein VMI54_08580 [Polyangiaceae bacterium]|nr:hypothetical protein [Polyangiaceae bacterium]